MTIEVFTTLFLLVVPPFPKQSPGLMREGDDDDDDDGVNYSTQPIDLLVHVVWEIPNPMVEAEYYDAGARIDRVAE